MFSSLQVRKAVISVTYFEGPRSGLNNLGSSHCMEGSRDVLWKAAGGGLLLGGAGKELDISSGGRSSIFSRRAKEENFSKY